MFPGEGLFVQVGSDDFRDVVDVVPGGVGVALKRVQLLVFGDLGDQPFQQVFSAPVTIAIAIGVIFLRLLGLCAFFLFQFLPLLFLY